MNIRKMIARPRSAPAQRWADAGRCGVPGMWRRWWTGGRREAAALANWLMQNGGGVGVAGGAGGRGGAGPGAAAGGAAGGVAAGDGDDRRGAEGGAGRGGGAGGAVAGMRWRGSWGSTRSSGRCCRWRSITSWTSGWSGWWTGSASRGGCPPHLTPDPALMGLLLAIEPVEGGGAAGAEGGAAGERAAAGRPGRGAGRWWGS